MRLSIRWLRQYLHTDIAVEQLVETLTMAGHEVEAELDLGIKSGRIVVGRVLEVAPHPNADKLHVCKVEAGAAEPLTIVCGAPNVAEGGLYPLALEGAVLPGGTVTSQATELPSRFQWLEINPQGERCSAFAHSKPGRKQGLRKKRLNPGPAGSGRMPPSGFPRDNKF